MESRRGQLGLSFNDSLVYPPHLAAGEEEGRFRAEGFYELSHFPTSFLHGIPNRR